MESEFRVFPDLIVGIQDFCRFLVDHTGEKFQVFVHVGSVLSFRVWAMLESFTLHRIIGIVYYSFWKSTMGNMI